MEFGGRGEEEEKEEEEEERPTRSTRTASSETDECQNSWTRSSCSRAIVASHDDFGRSLSTGPRLDRKQVSLSTWRLNKDSRAT